MSPALYKKLNDLREEYRRKMNKAADQAADYAQTDEWDKVSMFSTESERNREAFSALNRAIAIVEAHNDPPARHGGG